MPDKQRTQNASWVARHLGTSPQTVGRLIEEGKIKAYKLRDRGPWYILLDSVESFKRGVMDRHGITTGEHQR
jgi:hypothetical protein